MDELELLRALRPVVQPLSDSEVESIWDAIDSLTQSPSSEGASSVGMPALSPRRRGMRRRMVLAATAAAAIVMVATIGLLVRSTSPRPSGSSSASAPPIDAGGARASAGAAGQTGVANGGEMGGDSGNQYASDSSASCALSATPRELQRRAFAFSGTVLSSSMLDDGRARVTYAVDQWFRGGAGAEVIVLTDGPVPGEDTRGPLRGERQLVAGEISSDGSSTEFIGWSCGFTRTWSDGDALIWREAFE